MSRKTWQLDRRTFLRGVGVSCMLPYLEVMGPMRLDDAKGKAPRRACFVYFPNGCSLPEKTDTKYAHWRWFPDGEGKQFKFTKVLEPLEPYRDDIAIYGGLSHPKSRELLGHLAGDTWLTGGDLRGGAYKNSISLDQLAARHLEKHARYPSFVLSSDGGVGYKSRVATLSFDGQGRPIPAEHNQREIFERYFALSNGRAGAERRKSIAEGKKVVDLMLEESKRLAKRLGKNDRHKMDEFMSSINALEEQVRRNEKWLDTPIKPFKSDHIKFGSNPVKDPGAYIRTMYDLMVLGLQTDVTRVMSYMLAREDALGIGENWPRLTVGVNRGHHTISHDQHEGHFDQWGPYDRWYAEQFSYFVKRLKETEDEWGSLLDNTMVLYGSACSTTHNARNYPMAIAGGRNMGLQLGHYKHFSKSAIIEAQNNRITGGKVDKPKRRIAEDDLPCGDLYLSMLHALGIKEKSFAGSTDVLDGFFAKA